MGKKFINNIDKKGYINNIYKGEQSVPSLRSCNEELLVLIHKIRAKGKRVLVLSDITDLKKVSLAVRHAGIKMIQDLDYDRVAIYGGGSTLEKIVRVVIKASGRDFKIRYFEKKDEAENWLLL